VQHWRFRLGEVDGVRDVSWGDLVNEPTWTQKECTNLLRLSEGGDERDCVHGIHITGTRVYDGTDQEARLEKKVKI